MRQIEDYPLWLGNVGDVRDVRALLAADIRAVIDLAGNELPGALPREIMYCRFPLVDSAENPMWMLRGAAETVAALVRADVPTLVFCAAGMSRTPAIAAAGLALAIGCSAGDALKRVASGGAADVSAALWADIQLALE